LSERYEKEAIRPYKVGGSHSTPVKEWWSDITGIATILRGENKEQFVGSGRHCNSSHEMKWYFEIIT